MTHYKNLVVGCGFSGAVVAEQLASRLNEDVLLIDRKPHAAGNSHDYCDENGIYVHSYGPHTFHAREQRVWDYISRFTDWIPFMLRVRAVVEGNLLPLPFNFNSLRLAFPPSLADRLENKLLEKFEYGTKIPILTLRKTDDTDLKFLSDYIYRRIFLYYSTKQWGIDPESLDESVMSRIPVYLSRDDRYFQERNQGIPLEGYTRLIENMVRHPKIECRLNTDFYTIRDSITYDRLFFTGPIDRFFDMKFGSLPYRSLRFQYRHFDRERFQDTAIVNYPENYGFTRITEYKHFTGKICPKTIIGIEYPEAYEEGRNEPLYPINNPETRNQIAKYKAEAEKLKDTYFFGRLGAFRYLDMDQAVGEALDLADSVIDKIV